MPIFEWNCPICTEINNVECEDEATFHDTKDYISCTYCHHSKASQDPDYDLSDEDEPPPPPADPTPSPPAPTDPNDGAAAEPDEAAPPEPPEEDVCIICFQPIDMETIITKIKEVEKKN